MALRIYDGLNWFRDSIEAKNMSMAQMYYQIASNKMDTVIVVWEGKGGNDRRRKFYPAYKKNRVRPVEDIFRSVDLFKELLACTGAYQIAVPGYEGDDVVAALVKHLGGKGQQVYIHSTDKDFRQLIPLGCICDSNIIAECDDKYIRLYKTLVGDASDNIKGLQGFGKVAFTRLDAKYVQPFFERGHYDGFLPDVAFIEQKHFNKLVQDRQQIAVYWLITGFFDITMEEIGKHLQLGTADVAKADGIMKRFII